MEHSDAVAKLSALAHASRLQAFRLLVRRGPDGLSAGEIATELGVAPPTLSFHLSQLTTAGLIRSRRDGRHVIYAIDPEGIRDVLAYLVDDCCGGRPGLCWPEGNPCHESSSCSSS